MGPPASSEIKYEFIEWNRKYAHMGGILKMGTES